MASTALRRSVMSQRKARATAAAWSGDVAPARRVFTCPGCGHLANRPKTRFIDSSYSPIYRFRPDQSGIALAHHAKAGVIVALRWLALETRRGAALRRVATEIAAAQ